MVNLLMQYNNQLEWSVVGSQNSQFDLDLVYPLSLHNILGDC